MKRMKQVMSWLLVLVMMISLMPANLARAEGEQSEKQSYNIYLNEDINTNNAATPYNVYTYTPDWDTSIVPDWSIEVPEQDSVEKQENSDWLIVTGSITFYVTIPEHCDVNALYLEQDGVKMENVEIETTDTENKYAFTATPTDNAFVQICDGTFISMNAQAQSDYFTYTIPTDIQDAWGNSCYEAGKSYTLYVSKNEDDSEVTIDDLGVTVNGQQVELTPVEDETNQWSYELGVMSGKICVVRIYDEGCTFSVAMPNLNYTSEEAELYGFLIYGYEIYDATGETKLDVASGEIFSVQKDNDLSFVVKPVDDVEQLKFGLFVGEEELVPTINDDGTLTFTISNVQWNMTVDVCRKYTLGVDEASSVKIIPCTENGDSLVETSVSEYDALNYNTVYFKLDVDNHLDYEVTHEGATYLPDENGLYQAYISDADVVLNIAEHPKSTVSMDGALFIPCTYDGTNLVEEAVSEYQYRSYETAYFKLDMDGNHYRIFKDEEELGCDENGVYSVWVEESNFTISVETLYEIKYKETSGYYVYMGSMQEDYETGEMDGDYNVYYVPGEFLVSVAVVDGWNTDNMQVCLQDAEGSLTEISAQGEPSLNQWNELQYDYVPTITENVTIVVSGLYENEESTFVLSYNEEKFSDITMKILDESGEVVPWLEYWDTTGEKATDIYRGKIYTLVLSGDEEDLNRIRMTAEGEELTGSIENGELMVDVTNYTSIAMALDGEYYVNYDDSEDDTYSLVIREYQPNNLDEIRTVSGFYPGTLSFWIDSDDGNVSAEEAYVVSVKDSIGATITPTTTANVTVDNMGTKRTVYTVNFTSDITIQCAGAKRYEFDVNLPIPATDDYTISSLYYVEDAWDDSGEWYENAVEYTGVIDTTKGYTSFADITAGNSVYFDVTTDASNGTPYVKRTSNRGGDTSVDDLSLYSEPEVLENGKVKYTYAFNVEGLTDIRVSVDTADISVVADGYYPLYDEDYECWCIYDANPDVGEASVVLKIYNLPKRIDVSDTEAKYYIDYYLCDHTLMVDDQNYDKFFTLQGEGKEDLELTYIEDGDYQGCYEAPLQDGYTTLAVDMSLLEPRNGKVSLRSYRDDITIEIVGTEGEDYIALENQEFDYKVQNQTLTFKVTAEGDSFPEDVFVDFGGCEIVESEVSEDGLTKTYTIHDVLYNHVISVSYVATLTLEESAYGWLDVEFYGQGAQWDENDNLISYGTYGAGVENYIILGVEEGYDVDSVKVIQKYFDAEGNEQITTYNQLLPWHTDTARRCRVTMAEGENIFSITQPKKITYTMSMPTSAAYTIEYVNGSTTAVGYNDSFSFMLKAKAGYNLNGVTVTANGKKMTSDANGVYTITNVKENYTIAVSGFATSKYVVTFKDYDGKVLKAQSVEYGKAATAPSSPTRTGYTFAGWDQSFNKVTNDITVTATYKPVLVTKLTITGDSKSLAVNKTMKLSATALPAHALNSDVVWSTSNKKYATVSASGKVKALKKGAGKTVTITATAKDGSGVKATYKIKIYKNAVKKIKLSAKTTTVKAGKKVTIKAKFTPSKSICKTLKWTSSNKKWATVNSKGVVTTKKAGKGKTVKITAKATDGSNKKATIKIKIKK